MPRQRCYQHDWRLNRQKNITHTTRITTARHLAAKNKSTLRFSHKCNTHIPATILVKINAAWQIAIKIVAYISPICREAPLKGIYMKFCIRGHLANVINRAKFYLNQIRGFDSVGGRIFGFSIKREVAVNTGLELPFSLWCKINIGVVHKWHRTILWKN